MSSRKKLMIGGGGTGGHVLAGVAIAEVWKATQSEEILFVGAHGGIEEKLVPRAGFPLELLQLGSLNRVSARRRLLTLLQLPFALWKSLYLLLRERPSAVVGVGGYASGPLVLMARGVGWIWGCRTAILEQNAIPGFTNRVLGKSAQTVFAAFPGLEKVFSAQKIQLTGNPIRSVMKQLPPAQTQPFTIFVFGGSQGALGINTLVIDAIGELKGVPIQWIHQTGEADFERVAKAHQERGTGARVEKFIHGMMDAYSQASLLICRSGASTLSEIACVGRASILIPFPYAADNHQEKNAQVYVNAGAARLLPQLKSKGSDLAQMIRELVENPDALHRMEQAVRQFHRPQAAQDIVRFLS